MSEKAKYSISTSILKAIQSMYKYNIIHGDIKPCNLVVHEDGENLYIKVIDYGSCKHKDSSDKIDYVVGTNGYYAPEQMDGILNHKSDIYSIGVTIIELWTSNIFNKNTDKFNVSRSEVLKTLRTIKDNFPELENILRKCIDLNYKKRPDIEQLINLFTKLNNH